MTKQDDNVVDMSQRRHKHNLKIKDAKASELQASFRLAREKANKSSKGKQASTEKLLKIFKPKPKPKSK